jgi:hypothetical protein
VTVYFWSANIDVVWAEFPGRTFQKPSAFLLHNVASLHVNAVREMLSRDLPLEKMMKIYQEVTAFLWYGAMGIMGERQAEVRESRQGGKRHVDRHG